MTSASGSALAVDYVEYFLGDAPVFLLQRADRAVDRIGDAGARRQLERGERIERPAGRTASRRARGARNNRWRARWRRRRCRTAPRAVSDVAGCGVSVWNISSVSMNSSSVSTSTQPVWRDSATHARSSPASEPVCDAAAARPCRVRPPFRMTTGFARLRCAQHLKQAPPVLRRLDVKTDHLGLRIGEIELEHVDGVSRRSCRR